MWDRARDQGAQLQNITDQKLVGVQGAPLYLHGRTQIQFELPPERFSISVIVADTQTADVILGCNFLRNQRCSIALGNDGDTLHVQTRGQSIPIAQDLNAQISCHNVIIQESMTVPPRGEVEVIRCIPVEATCTRCFVIQQDSTFNIRFKDNMCSI